MSTRETSRGKKIALLLCVCAVFAAACLITAAAERFVAEHPLETEDLSAISQTPGEGQDAFAEENTVINNIGSTAGEPVQFSLDAGFYDAAQSLALSAEDSAEILYTRDGSDPAMPIKSMSRMAYLTIHSTAASKLSYTVCIMSSLARLRGFVYLPVGRHFEKSGLLFPAPEKAEREGARSPHRQAQHLAFVPARLADKIDNFLAEGIAENAVAFGLAQMPIEGVFPRPGAQPEEIFQQNRDGDKPRPAHKIRFGGDAGGGILRRVVFKERAGLVIDGKHMIRLSTSSARS